MFIKDSYIEINRNSNIYQQHIPEVGSGFRLLLDNVVFLSDVVVFLF